MSAADTHGSDSQSQVRHRIWGLLAGYAAWGVFWGGWGALLPAVKSRAGASDAALGVVLLCVAAGALPAMLLVGPLVDRFGNRALVASLGLFGVSIPGVGAATSLVSLGLALLLLGAASGAVDVALNARVGALEAATGRRLFNQAHAAFPLAVVIASPAVGLARQAGVTPVTILAVMASLVLITAMANLGGRVPDRDARGAAGAAVAARPGRPRRRLSRTLLLLGLVGAGIHIIENAVEQWSAIFLEGEADAGLGAGPAVGSLGPAVYMGMLFVGRLVADRYGQALPARRVLAMTALSAAVSMGLVAVAAHPAVAIAGFALAGLGMAAGIPTIFALTARSVPVEERGAAIGTVTALAYGGYLLGPPLVGGVASVVGLRGAWLALVLVAALVLIACRVIGNVENER